MLVRRSYERTSSMLLYVEVGVGKQRGRKCSKGSFPYRIVKRILWLHYSYSKVDCCLRTKPRDPNDVCPCRYHHPCHQVPRATPPKVDQVPSAPSLSLVLFNSEEHSDLAFFVGEHPGGQWRFPAHSFVVSPASPVLEALVSRCRSVLEDPSIPEEYQDLLQEMSVVDDVCQITVKGTQPDIFENLLRYIYTKKTSFQCVGSCLQTLAASIKFQVCPLSYICLEYLTENVNEVNVLEVLAGIRGPCPNQADHDDNLRNELITKCFCLIDDNADRILNSEIFENLDRTLVVDIVSRDTLRVTSEVIVFNTLVKWSCQECKRRRIQIIADNKREVLGNTLFCARFLMMTHEEFKQGPALSGMLTDQEQRSVMSKLDGLPSATIAVPGYLACKARDVPNVVKIKTVPPHSSRKCNEHCKNKLHGNQTGDNGSASPVKKPKRSRLLNGLGDIMIGVFTLLD